MSRIGFFCATRDDTVAAGRWLGRRVKPGDVVLVQGPLGAGKTTFIQGLVDGYGLADTVTSPTFALVHEYGPPAKRVVHVDPFRLETPEEVESVGIEEYYRTSEDYFGKPPVVVMEWPERLTELLPDRHIHVQIELRENEERIVFIGWRNQESDGGTLS